MIKIFWPTTRFFTKIFLTPLCDHFGRWNPCHDISKSAGSQRNDKPSDNDSMTADSMETFIKNYLPNNFRLRILGNKKVLKKSQIGWKQTLVPSLPSRNKILVITVKNYTEADFKSFFSPVQFCLTSLLSSKYFIQVCTFVHIIQWKNLWLWVPDLKQGLYLL